MVKYIARFAHGHPNLAKVVVKETAKLFISESSKDLVGRSYIYKRRRFHKDDKRVFDTEPEGIEYLIGRVDSFIDNAHAEVSAGVEIKAKLEERLRGGQ